MPCITTFNGRVLHNLKIVNLFMSAHWDEHGFGIGVLRLKATGERVGVFALFRTHVENEAVLEIGWMIAPAFQRQGLAFESASTLIEYVRQTHAPCVVTAFPSAVNPSSNRTGDVATTENEGYLSR